MRRSHLKSMVSLTLSIAILTGCQRGSGSSADSTPTEAPVPTDVSTETCASETTETALNHVLLGTLQPNIFIKQQIIDDAWRRSKLSLSAVTLAAINEDIHKISCSAKMHFATLSIDGKEIMSGDFDIEFDVQKSVKNGEGLVYTIRDSKQIVDSITSFVWLSSSRWAKDDKSMTEDDSTSTENESDNAFPSKDHGGYSKYSGKIAKDPPVQSVYTDGPKPIRAFSDHAGS